MATLKIYGTPVFEKLWDAITSWNYKIIVLEGGSRSSKTWSIIQALILLSYQKERRITGWRLKRVWVKPTIHYDFQRFLKKSNVYDKMMHNESELIFRIGNSTVEFGGFTDSEGQKLHGFTQDIAWVNEAIESDKNSFDQLEQRTNELIILDYNPTEEESWIYDLRKRDDVLFIHSTYKDNPFIAQASKRKIESYEDNSYNRQQGTVDEYKWKVYGLGLPAKREGLIFPNYEIIEDWPEEAKLLGYGLDFGFFPDPAAFGRAGLFNGRLVLDEIFYENELNNIIIHGREELPSIQSRLQENNIKRRDLIIADSAAKVNINELKSVGYNIQPVVKYAGSVIDGIELMKKYQPFYITSRSVNCINEIKNYTYKKNMATGLFLKEPVDDFNHLFDLFRYIVQTSISVKQSKGIKKITFKK